MTTSEHELRQMLGEVYRMPPGPARSAAFDTVLRHADAAEATAFAFHARMQAIWDFHHTGDYTRAFMAFSWCVATFDRHPELVVGAEHDLLWKFKWIVWELAQFPAVPLDRTVALLDDMERRYRDGNHSPHAVYQHRGLVAQHLGDLDAADEWYEKMLTARRDSLSDCAACVPSSLVQHLVARGRYEEAVDAGAPYTKGGCTEQPQWMLSELLLAYLHTGRLDRAVDAHREAYRLIRDSRHHLELIALHLQFCGLTGNEAHALPIVERHLPWLDNPSSPLAAMEFASASALVLRRLADGGAGDRPVRRRGDDGTVRPHATVATTLTEMRALTRELAALFDARNGNSYQSGRMEARMAAEPLVAELPLTVLAGRPIEGGKRDERVDNLVATVAERTVAGDHAGAARAQLDVAYVLRDAGRWSDAVEAAEEAIRGLELAGLDEDRLRAAYLLFQLYAQHHSHHDDVDRLAVELLEAPALPGSVPAFEALAEEVADRAYGGDLTGYLRRAAAIHREHGRPADEARVLRKAVRRHRTPSAEWHAMLARLDELTDQGALPPDDVSALSIQVGSTLVLDGDIAGALERATRTADRFGRIGGPHGLGGPDSPDRPDRPDGLGELGGPDGLGGLGEPPEHRIFRAHLLLRVDRPADAAALVQPLTDADEAYAWDAQVITARSLLAQGRHGEAEAYMDEHDIDPEYDLFDEFDDDQYDDEFGDEDRP